MTASAATPRFGLYVHVPFCVRKCVYCDFLSVPIETFSKSCQSKILSCLASEIEFAIERNRASLGGRALSTVYFGGGTPSLLPPEIIDHLLSTIEKAFGVSRRQCCEISLECNPVSSEMDRLEAYVGAGVNRISLGVQSFDDNTLIHLGRSHSGNEALEACRRLSKTELRSWGLDLIFGAPWPVKNEKTASRNDRQRFSKDLEIATALGAPHLSVYGMTVHEETPLWKQARESAVLLPDEEAQREMFLEARRRLLSSGYRHYEISNYALPDHESRHNSLYWTGGEYLGIGPGAHSFFNGVRCSNPSDLSAWVESVERGEWSGLPEEPPDKAALRGERIMLALRKLDGVPVEALDHMVEGDFSVLYGDVLSDLRTRKLIDWDGHRLRLSQEGLLLSDMVFEAFF